MPVLFLPALGVQTSSVWSPPASLQRLWFYRHPRRCDRDQRSRGDPDCHLDGPAAAARAAPRRRRIRGLGQGCRQEGRHRHNQGQSSGESVHSGHRTFFRPSQDHDDSLYPLLSIQNEVKDSFPDIFNIPDPNTKNIWATSRNVCVPSSDSLPLDIHEACRNTFINSSSVTQRHSGAVCILTPIPQIVQRFCKHSTSLRFSPSRISLSLSLRLLLSLSDTSIRAHVWAEEASRALSGPFSWSETRRVCGCHWQPLRPAEHRHHWHRQHGSERRQGAGHQGLRHGLHPDWRYH